MIRWLPLLLLVVLTGCVKNEMTLTFSFPEKVNSHCRIVYYASAKGGGMMKETTANISNGKGEMKLVQVYPSVMFLYSSSAKTPSALIYAGRGDKISVTGKDGDIKSWEITGNDVTDELTEWRLKNLKVIEGGNADRLNKAVAEYVGKHPGSRAAAIILYVYFDRRGHEAEFSALLGKFDKKILEDEKLMTALSMADLMTGLPEAPSYPASIILTGSEGYADTLELKKGVKTMLLFRKERNSTGTVPSDSLKKLVAARGSKVVAELFMDPDSLTWNRHLEQDSIVGIKRMWMPLGTADSTAMKMGVRRIPYYIVLSPEGKELYRGDNWKEAANKFEN